MKLDVNDIKKFELLPGETLVVRFEPGRVSRVMSKAFREKFEELFPNNKLLFMPNSMEISEIIKETEG
jgi:hypothetical protein